MEGHPSRANDATQDPTKRRQWSKDFNWGGGILGANCFHAALQGSGGCGRAPDTRECFKNLTPKINEKLQILRKILSFLGIFHGKFAIFPKSFNNFLDICPTLAQNIVN